MNEIKRKVNVEKSVDLLASSGASVKFVARLTSFQPLNSQVAH